MYTLYYSPGSCSLVIHCLLEEPGTWERAKTLKNIEPFFRRMSERPAVVRAMAREGIKAFG